MRLLKKSRYLVFLVALDAGIFSLVFWVFDYFVLFRPSWAPTAADRLFGFGAWFDYLSERGSSFLLISIFGLCLAGLMWLLPGKLSDCRAQWDA